MVDPKRKNLVAKVGGDMKTPVSTPLKPDFGTYHHSTPKSSEKARTIIRQGFITGFGSLPFSKDEKISILDIGCGLGFISCVCAEYYGHANVTGIDIFGHVSLKDSSISKAKENARILGLSDRIHFKKEDALSSNYNEDKFDLFVSNLVFHNFGKRRFEAYDRLASWMAPNSYALLGEVFFNRKADMKYLSKTFKIEKEIKPKIEVPSYWILALSKIG
jgi:cyclopropane fatty-acyl-phospholipid synthase-like methyltransferase